MGGFEWGCGKVPRVVGGRHLSHRGKNGSFWVASRVFHDLSHTVRLWPATLGVGQLSCQTHLHPCGCVVIELCKTCGKAVLRTGRKAKSEKFRRIPGRRESQSFNAFVASRQPLTDFPSRCRQCQTPFGDTQNSRLSFATAHLRIPALHGGFLSCASSSPAAPALSVQTSPASSKRKATKPL